MKNVLIVDDHPVARLAVRMVLEKENLTVIAETDDGLHNGAESYFIGIKICQVCATDR